MPKKLTDYKNFWLIWLGCAGSSGGTSLFKIQREWGITTNYLYHRQAGLKKPLYTAMIAERFIEKEERRIKARFDWIPEYMIERHRPKEGEWSLGMFIIERWGKIQGFIEKHHEALFDLKALRVLYPDTKSILRAGRDIFDDIFTVVFASNILPFCAKYRANVVARIIYTMMSVTPGRDILAYFKRITSDSLVKNTLPQLIADEIELMRVIHPVQEEGPSPGKQGRAFP
jgi:hypothetical protein